MKEVVPKKVKVRFLKNLIQKNMQKALHDCVTKEWGME